MIALTSPPPSRLSIARALSTHLSTSALDKAPQSQSRGITLDLGFSAFYLPTPPSLSSHYSLVQFTLVDCPGHASLIRTIIGGAQIIDLMLLVIDATKGIQTQTAECLVLGEMLTDHLVLVNNKADLLTTSAQREKLEKGLRQTFKGTKFGADVPMAYTSCQEGKEADIGGLLNLLTSTLTVPSRAVSDPFYMAIDHAFLIKGQGTVLTGTILTGRVSVNSPIYLPSLRLTRKVKSIQVFHTPVDQASAGDRAALCVVGLEAEKVERGVACEEGGVEWVERLIVRVEKVRFYKEDVKTGQQMHVSIGHDTLQATCTFFNTTPTPSSPIPVGTPTFDPALAYLSLPALPAEPALALLTFPQPVALPTHFSPPIIASHLNAHYTGRSCRLAFRAFILTPLQPTQHLRLYKEKMKEGRVERMGKDGEVIGKGIWKGVEEVARWVGFRVEVEGEGWGRIEGGFGKGGKFRVRLEGRRALEEGKGEVKDDGMAGSGEGERDGAGSSTGGKAIRLRYRQLIDEQGKKQMTQA